MAAVRMGLYSSTVKADMDGMVVRTMLSLAVRRQRQKRKRVLAMALFAVVNRACVMAVRRVDSWMMSSRLS